jgi:hypothetical protein
MNIFPFYGQVSGPHRILHGLGEGGGRGIFLFGFKIKQQL